MSDLKYVGITVGPILDTLNEATSPASLWLSSSVFSDITKRLCKEVLSSFKSVTIYTPYYGDDIISDDGIGKFHDRIIFSSDNVSRDELNRIVDKVKEETAPRLSKEYSENNKIKCFLDKYIQIHFCIIDKEKIEGKKVILEISPYLDALELMKAFPETNENNPFRNMFKEKNKLIKDSPIFQKIDPQKNQLTKNNSDDIKDLDSIANCNNTTNIQFKYLKYFAIVQADGDSMSTFLSKTSNERVTEFSRACLKYAEEVSGKIKEYGGVTVYAGGDDILFIAPVKTDKSNIFTLCSEINELFKIKITEAGFTENIPTISFGISIQYHKFPLYEALSNAQRLLFDVAKSQKNKNCMAIDIVKHSGQTVSLIIDNPWIDVFKKIVFTKSDNEKTPNSILYALEEFSILLEIAVREAINGNIGKGRLRNIFDNMFDNINQKCAKEYLDSLTDVLYCDFINKNIGIRLQDNDFIKYKSKEKKIILTLEGCLRIKKFLEERGD